MIIIPSMRTVVLTPPKTGSRSIRLAVLETHHDAVSPYRHMERAGIPEEARGFDVVGIMREPRRRLFSVWHYMQTRLQDHPSDPNRSRELREDAQCHSFEDWLEKSSHTFNSNVASSGLRFGPPYVVKDDFTPIARRSLEGTFRPDLGEITLIALEDLAEIEGRLGISLAGLRENDSGSGRLDIPESTKIESHMKTYFSWDMAAFAQSMQPVQEPDIG